MHACVSVPGLIAGVVCSSRGMVGVTVSGRVVVSTNKNKTMILEQRRADRG